jgi:putative ubiquitin-RnfH superfamily antitoxin RatB of RatAB toxin-antitoxin module
LALDGLAVGVWGKLRALDETLRDRDRVEIYRPLLVDPKEARRQRYQSHRAKAKP